MIRTAMFYLASGWLTIGLLLAGEATWLPVLAFNTGPFLLGMFLWLTVVLLLATAAGAWHTERTRK